MTSKPERVKEKKDTTKSKGRIDSKENVILPNLISPITEEKFSSFLNNLTIEKLKLLSEQFQAKELDLKPKKKLHFKKAEFIQVLDLIFTPPGQKFIYSEIYELIFKRFKSIKYKIKPTQCNILKTRNKYDIFYHPSCNNSYFITDIYNEDQINCYDVLVALACFVKCDFDNKIKLLFQLTDVDDDGYISENELKNLIYTLYFVFSEEQKPINLHSNVMHQSLTSIKSQQVIDKIMNYPGELSKVFQIKNYVNNNDFIESVHKIINYKYFIFPIIGDFKQCLLTTREEKDLNVSNSNLQDFMELSNELISSVKENTLNTACNNSKDDPFIQNDANLFTNKFKRKNKKLLNKKIIIKNINTTEKLPNINVKISKNKIFESLKYNDASNILSYNNKIRKLTLKQIHDVDLFPWKINITNQNQNMSLPICNNYEGRQNRRISGLNHNIYSINNNNEKNEAYPVNKTKLRKSIYEKNESYNYKENKKLATYLTNKEILDEIYGEMNRNNINDDFGVAESNKISKKITNDYRRIKNNIKVPKKEIYFGKASYIVHNKIDK